MSPEVVLNADALDDDDMLAIARSLKFSHTAFLSKSRNADCVFAVRFVTPNGQLKNCAHATIAAHCFWAKVFGVKRDQPTKQETMAGLQEVRTTETDEGPMVYFRQNPIVQEDVDTATIRQLTDALGCSAETLHSAYPVKLASPGSFRFLVPLRSRQDLLALRPDFVKLNNLCREVESIGCFAFWIGKIAQPCEAHGRMFAPTIGVDEDAVNGNSSGCLGAADAH
jgi:trans-2,3-dihydro-3-hydroxyanthranilate isomerase